MNLKWFLSAALLLSCTASIAQTKTDDATERSARSFVQSFYSWYVKQPEGNFCETALKAKRASFSRPLATALQADFDASAKVTGEIVGLEFDPFVNAQDVAQKYTATVVKRNGASYLVDVYGTWDGKKSTKPDVTPELKQVNGKWVFVNFHYGKTEYPVNENLISVLKQLKSDREKPQSK